MEHDFFDQGMCGGNVMQLMKHSDRGGIDLVCQQLYPGQRPINIYQTPKLASSVSHIYGRQDNEDIAFSEVYGAYGQTITYPQMKWLADWHQVRGVNYLISHSFNPRAPFDTDCPPYFYNGGDEPRWPLYRIWADYTSRLSLMLSGGRHVCPVAFVHVGQSMHVGRALRPEEMTSALQDALYDCDWLPYDAWEDHARIDGKVIRLRQEDYRVLVVPAAEVIPWETLNKAKTFLDAGGGGWLWFSADTFSDTGQVDRRHHWRCVRRSGVTILSPARPRVESHLPAGDPICYPRCHNRADPSRFGRRC